MVARYRFSCAGIARLQFETTQGRQSRSSQSTRLINTFALCIANEVFFAQREDLSLLATPQGCPLGALCHQYPTRETKVVRRYTCGVLAATFPMRTRYKAIRLANSDCEDMKTYTCVVRALELPGDCLGLLVLGASYKLPS